MAAHFGHALIALLEEMKRAGVAVVPMVVHLAPELLRNLPARARSQRSQLSEVCRGTKGRSSGFLLRTAFRGGKQRNQPMLIYHLKMCSVVARATSHPNHHTHSPNLGRSPRLASLHTRLLIGWLSSEIKCKKKNRTRVMLCAS